MLPVVRKSRLVDAVGIKWLESLEILSEFLRQMMFTLTVVIH